MAKHKFVVIKGRNLVVGRHGLHYEIFLNINSVSWGPKAGFDQNRIFVGPVYNIDDRQRVEFGYMNNYVNKDLKSDLDNHVMVINYYYNFTDF